MLPSDREHRRRAYALRRMSLAVDRVIRRENPDQAGQMGQSVAASIQGAGESGAEGPRPR